MFEDLMSPISSELPCGEFLKLNKSEYRALRNSYNNALSSFRKLIETPDNYQDDDLVSDNEKNWSVFSALARDVLIHKTKDIEVLCWYATSQIFTKNYIYNVGQVLEVLYRWLTVFWDDLNPKVAPHIIDSLSDEEVAKRMIEAKITPLMQFSGDTLENNALYGPLQMSFLAGDVTFGDYINSQRNNTINELKQRALQAYNQEVDDKLQTVEQVNVRLDEIEKFINTKSSSVGCFFHIKYLKQLFFELGKSLETLFGEIIDKSKTVASQEETVDSIDIVNSNKLVNREEEKNNEKNMTVNEIKMDCSGLHNRDSAFSQLRLIADFFKKTEPHSPVPFLIERAIRWGYMDFPELMREMISQDEQVLNHVNLLSGMDNVIVTLPDVKSSSQHTDTSISNCMEYSSEENIQNQKLHEEFTENDVKNKSEVKQNLFD